MLPSNVTEIRLPNSYDTSSTPEAIPARSADTLEMIVEEATVIRTLIPVPARNRLTANIHKFASRTGVASA